MVDIFTEGKELQGNKFEFKEVGDKIQGTYVSKDQVDTRYGKAWIYEIKDEAGDFWIIWGKSSIDRVMKHVKLGQIIGFIVEDIRPSRGGGNDFIDIKVIADPNIVDEEWIRENDMINAEEVKTPEGGDTIEDAMKEMTKDVKPEASSSDADKQIARIRELAMSKLGVEKLDEIQEAVMESTNTAWIPSNFKDIISKLEAM